MCNFILNILVVITLVILSGCWVYNSFSESKLIDSWHSRELTNCLDTANTNIGKFLNTEGYYEEIFMDSVMYNIKNQTHFKWDTVKVYHVLYANGLFASNIAPSIGIVKSRRDNENYLKLVNHRSPTK